MEKYNGTLGASLPVVLMIFTVAFFLSFAFVNAQEDTTVTNTAVTNVSETSSNDTAPSINKKRRFLHLEHRPYKNQCAKDTYARFG